MPDHAGAGPALAGDGDQHATPMRGHVYQGQTLDVTYTVTNDGRRHAAD